MELKDAHEGHEKKGKYTRRIQKKNINLTDYSTTSLADHEIEEIFESKAVEIASKYNEGEIPQSDLFLML